MDRLSFFGPGGLAALFVVSNAISPAALPFAPQAQATQTPTRPAATAEATQTPTRPAATAEATATRRPTATVRASSGSGSTAITQTLPLSPSAIISDDAYITVQGLGQADTTPDVALIEVGVQTRGPTASGALSQTNAQLSQLLSVLTAAGIEQRDIQTTNASLFPVFEQNTTNNDPPQPIGFNATNIVRVRIRDLDSLGEILDDVVGAGANTIQSIQFESSDPLAALSSARELAIADAQRKAEQLARLVNGRLGAIRAIVESRSAVPFATLGTREAGGGVPILPGTQSVQVVVDVTWQLR